MAALTAPPKASDPLATRHQPGGCLSARLLLLREPQCSARDADACALETGRAGNHKAGDTRRGAIAGLKRRIPSGLAALSKRARVVWQDDPLAHRMARKPVTSGRSPIARRTVWRPLSASSAACMSSFLRADERFQAFPDHRMIIRRELRWVVCPRAVEASSV